MCVPSPNSSNLKRRLGMTSSAKDRDLDRPRNLISRQHVPVDSRGLCLRVRACVCCGCQCYQEVVPLVPLLAPFFDRMTTHVVPERFKVEDALAFLEELTRQVPHDVFKDHVLLQSDYSPVDDPSTYWSWLPLDFCDTWAAYRTPPPTRPLKARKKRTR